MARPTKKSGTLPTRSERSYRDPRNADIFSIVLLIVILIAIDFRFLNQEHSWFDAFYATANVLSTVGNSGTKHQTFNKVWPLVLMLGGIGFLANTDSSRSLNIRSGNCYIQACKGFSRVFFCSFRTSQQM